MNRSLAPGYDLFKLVVTLVLAIVTFILLLRGCAGTTPPATPPPATLPPSATPVPSTLAPSTTPLPPTAAPSPTLLPTATSSPTLLPSPTATPPPVVTPELPPGTATAAVGPENPDCPGAARSRLKIGDRVRVMNNVNLRQDPGLTGRWIITNLTGTVLEIIGGPGCTHIKEQAYEWWRVRRPDGKEGWSAEASLLGHFYFLEPTP